MVQRESVKGKPQPELAALRLIEFQVMEQIRTLKKQLGAADPQDLPAALELAAWELGVGSVPASIYEPEKAREIRS